MRPKKTTSTSTFCSRSNFWLIKDFLLKGASLILIIALVLTSTPGPVFAITSEDQRSINLNTIYYSANDPGSGGCSGNASSSTLLPNSITSKISGNQADYQEVGRESGVPWQMLAAIHYRESTFSKTNPGNGQGIFQFVNKEGGPYPPGPVSDQEFRRQLGFVADQIQNDYVDRNLSKHQGKFNGPPQNPDKVKDTFFSYNGRADVYKQQAASLGFDPQTQPFEGSPYVMNKFDAKRENMGIITKDGGSLDGTDTRYGAFTIYAALADVSCANPSGEKIVDIALQEYAKNVKENPDGCNCGGRIDVYTDGNPEPWCSDFVSWVYKEAGSPFTGGASGGWRIPAVASLKAWFQENATYFEKTKQKPQPGDVIFFYSEGGNTDTSSGNHNGIVVEVSGEQITTVEGNASNAVTKRTYDYLINDYVVGFGRKQQ